MIAALIRWSVANRFLVVLATLFLAAAGLWGVRTTPVDALPDLSDVQVIIRTTLPGQAPQIVENQVTYPLATTMLSVPGARTVLLVLDVIENLLAQNWNGMATGYLWSMIWPASLRGLRTFVETNISLFLWQRVVMPLLMLPLWSVLLILGGILFFSGRRDDTPP